MKTIKTFLLALVLLVAFNVHAADDLNLKVNNNQNLIVKLEQIEQGSVLSLQNSSGEIIFKDRFYEENTYSKTLNFKDLPDGKYTLSFEKKYSISTFVIRKKENGVQIDDSAYKFIFKPTLKIEGDKVLFHLVNPYHKYAWIEIYDHHGALVGSVQSDETVVKKTLDFSRMPKGDYSVKVKIDHQQFTETVSL